MEGLSRIGLAGLSGMGQNLALNIADKGFPISVYNRTASKVEETVDRAFHEGLLPVYGHRSPADFVLSIQRPRSIILRVKAGSAVDETISALSQFMEPGDAIIDAGNAWHEDTERRIRDAHARGLLYLGMGVSGGLDGARHGPSLISGGSFQAYQNIQDVLTRIAAQNKDGPCVAYVEKGGSGHFVHMVHDYMEYGYVQLISEAHRVLKVLGGFSNSELAKIFAEWNRGELESFLINFAAEIFEVNGARRDRDLVDNILDKTGVMHDGRILVEACMRSIFLPNFVSRDCSRRFNDKEREAAARLFGQKRIMWDEDRKRLRSSIDKQRLIHDVRQALYASMICSYAQGMHLLRVMSEEKAWSLNFGELARVWKGGSTIRARFLDSIKKAYERNQSLTNLIIDSEFAGEVAQRLGAWTRVICLATKAHIRDKVMSTSFEYYFMVSDKACSIRSASI